MNPCYIITQQGVSLSIDNKPYLILKDNEFYNDVINAIRNRKFDLVKVFVDKATAIKHISHGKVVVEGGVIKYNGQSVHNIVTERILEFLKDGLPFEPLMAFLENLLQNPSQHSIDETYRFLENKNLPLTEDGCFLAYKAVRHDFKDKHTGKIDNHIGKKVSMLRENVDANTNNECSNGFHVGTINYVKNFGNGSDKFLLVKVNPKDVVSVPYADAQKMRVCAYKVMAEYKENLVAPCYKAFRAKKHPVQTKSKFANNSWKKQKRNKKGMFV